MQRFEVPRRDVLDHSAVARDEARLAVVGLALVMFLDEGVAVGPVDVVVEKSATARKRRKK
jgi:hypothetical protein